MSNKTPFENWWYYEGSAPPKVGEDLEEFTKRMCQNAWAIGAAMQEQEQEHGEPKIGCVNHDCDKCTQEQGEPVVWQRSHYPLCKSCKRSTIPMGDTCGWACDGTEKSELYCPKTEEQGEPVAWAEFVDRACGLIKAADDAAAENDYMLDSDDCILVLRGTWKGNYLNDHPQPKAKQEHSEPVALETVYETIIHWDEGGGKRSRRELARRIVALYTTPQPKQEQPQELCPSCRNGSIYACTCTFKPAPHQPQPKQEQGEPVAWITPDGEGFRIRFSPPVNDVPLGWDALYTTPQPKQEQGEPVAWCRYEDGMWVYYETKAWDDLQPLYTTPQQRKPLLIGKEAAEFAKWFNAVWLGDGEQGETIPTSGKEYDDYLSQHTLAFGAWMAAKESAHGIAPRPDGSLINEGTKSKQEQGEPVAWITPDGEGFRIRFSPPVNDVPLGWDALYTTPQQPKQEQRSVSEQLGEPVALVQDLGEVKRKHLVYELGFDWKDPLYTTPPQSEARGLSQQQRKPLTNEQIDAIWDAVITPSNHICEFVRAIEAAHGIAPQGSDK